VAWNLPDPVPVHREPIYTARPNSSPNIRRDQTDASSEWPISASRFRKRRWTRGFAKQFPIILTSGRLVKRRRRRGTRSNRWLCRIAAGHVRRGQHVDASERGIKDAGWVWVFGPENGSKTRVKALVTDRVGKGVAFMPFHFGRLVQGVDQRDKYRKARSDRAWRKREHADVLWLRPVTGMHEGKVTLCQIQSA